MHDLKFRDASGSIAAFLACEADSSFLDLLCEDGFLTAKELSEGQEAPDGGVKLLRRAIRRGFLAVDKDMDVSDSFVLAVKELDTLRVWTDLVDEDIHLRAPPRCA